jgi:FtsZ-interacting cell division protein ZipA
MKKILQENPETSNNAKSTAKKNIPVKKTAARKSSVQKPSLPKNNPEQHNQEKQKTQQKKMTVFVLYVKSRGWKAFLGKSGSSASIVKDGAIQNAYE